MSSYTDLIAVVAAEPGRYTTSSIAAGVIPLHGGSSVVHRRHCLELLRGGALVSRLNPDARRRVRTKRLYVGEVPVAVALGNALGPHDGVQSSRAGARDRARDRVDGTAAAPTAPHALPLVPAAVVQAAADERWYALPLSARIREDHDRVVREANKRGRRRVGSATLGATARPRDPALDAVLRARADNIYPNRGAQ